MTVQRRETLTSGVRGRWRKEIVKGGGTGEEIGMKRLGKRQVNKNSFSFFKQFNNSPIFITVTTIHLYS